MAPEAHISSEEDPFCGNSISGLLGCALGTPLPQTVPLAPESWMPPTPEHIAALLPQYRIERLIGRGGMGAVYKGRQITLNRPVAIKVLPAELAANAEFVARFHKEAQMLASLSHPNIVIIFEFGQTSEGHLFFVMEHVEGMDLHRLIQQAPPRAEQALRITVQICEAMQYAHEKGVIHRDIKPANVLVTPDGRVKLVDFGLATRPAESASQAAEPPSPDVFDPKDREGLLARRFTQPGSAVGTPGYAAPELYEGMADERSDIYALGIMLYEMLTGTPPTDYFPLPSTWMGVDRRVDEVVVKALAADPADRYQNVGEMKAAVERATVPLPAEPGPVARPQELPAKPLVERERSAGRSRRSGRVANACIAVVWMAAAGAGYDALHHWQWLRLGREKFAALWQEQRPSSQPVKPPSLAVAEPPKAAEPAKPPAKAEPPKTAEPVKIASVQSVPPVKAAVISTGATPPAAAEPARPLYQRVEGEAMKVLRMTGGVTEIQSTTRSLKAAVCSGSSYLWWHNARWRDSLTLQLNVQQSGLQRVRGLFALARNFGKYEVSLDGRPVTGSPFNLEAHDTTLAGSCDWGLFDLAAGPHELKLTLLGEWGEGGKDAPGMGLDYVQMEPPVMPVSTAVEGTNVARQADPSASACWENDNVRAINFGFEPANMRSGDRDLSRLSWFPRRGGMEWAQYEWTAPQKVNECRVFWFDDKNLPGGACALPAYWRLLYREPSGAWVPLDVAIPPAKDDQWSVVTFPAVTTTAMRIHLQCRTGWSAGICRWKVLAAGPDAKVMPPARHDISLCDLPPLHAQVGWDLPHANLYDTELDIKEGRVVWLKGRTCTQFLWAHARSYLEYAIPEGCTRFKTTGIGPTDKAAGRPSWNGAFKFIVKADDKVLFESKALNTYPNREVPMDLPLPKGAKKLELITSPTVDSTTWAHALWAYPTFGY